MVSIPPDATHGSRLKRFVLWLKDRIWATLDSVPKKRDGKSSQPHLENNTDTEVLGAVYERISAELKTEADRNREVENKLIAAGSVASIAVAIMVAVATSLPTGLQVLMAYAALQFLRATLAAINGLSRRSYIVPTRSDLLTDGTQGLIEYLCNACNRLVSMLEQHRETTNEKVGQLALAHVSINNALVALVFALGIPLGRRLIDLVWDPTGCVWLWIWRQIT